MITLFQFPAGLNVPNPSPYCLKVETFLRLAGLDYRVKTLLDPRKAPKGKLPFIKLDEEACSADALAYGVLANLIFWSLETPLGRLARGYPRLVAYCERLRERCWT